MAAQSAVDAANNLTADWLSRHTEGSTAVSGVGVWVLLAALLGGAAGEAEAELSTAVGLGREEALPAVRSVFALGSESAAVHAALGVWAHSSASLSQSWVDGLPPGMVGALSGVPAEDQAALDEWVASSTEGLLQSLPLQVTADTLLVLASALSVRTKWVSRFNAWPGTLLSGAWEGHPGVLLRKTSSDVSAVSVVGDVTLLRVDGQDDVDVHLVLGAPSAVPGAVVSAGVRSLSAGVVGVPGAELPLGSPGPGLEVAEVESTRDADLLEIATVAFDVRASHDLLDDASLFGLSAAQEVTPGHFPGISSSPLAVSQAAQDVMAQFTHEGFVAAAVTAVGLAAGSAPPLEKFTVRVLKVTFDRPFGFVALHRPSRLVLVAGWVDQPAPPDTA